MDFIFKSDKQILKILGERFKEARKRCGFTQDALAEKTNVSRTTITRFEQGQNISIYHFITLTRAVLHVTDLEGIMNVMEVIDPEAEFKEQIRKNGHTS